MASLHCGVVLGPDDDRLTSGDRGGGTVRMDALTTELKAFHRDVAVGRA